MDGQRVTINPLVTCMDCPACMRGQENLCAERQIISMPPREGAFAEYVTMPERNLVTVPDHVAFETAALAEPLAVSWQSVRLGMEALGETPATRALVIGGGTIGVAAALALRAFGAENVTVVEPNPLRLAYLKEHTDLCAHDVTPLVIEQHLEKPFPLTHSAPKSFGALAFE